MNRLENTLEIDKINGQKFDSLTRKDWISYLKNKNVCSIGAAALSWKMIHQFDFASIKAGSAIYLPL